MLTLVENDITDGYTQNLKHDTVLTYESLFKLYNLCYNDLFLNQDLYYVDMPGAVEYLIELEANGELFIYWLNKFSRTHLFSLAHVFNSYMKINELINPSKLLIKLLSNKYDNIQDNLWVGDIESLELSKNATNDILKIQEFAASGTINELSEFATDNVNTLYEYNDILNVSKILMNNFNVETFKLIESIHAKLKIYISDNGFTWPEIVPELLIFGNYSETINNVNTEYKIEDVGLTLNELEFCYKKSEILRETKWIYEDLNFAKKIENNKNLDLLRIF